MAKYFDQMTNWANRHYRLVVAFAVVLMVVLAIVANSHRFTTTSTIAIPVATSTQEVVQTLPADVLPTQIRIPSVNITAAFEEPLGLNADQTIEVPKAYTTVGWYKFGPVPGELGPAVVLGHVDSYQGPAAFWALGQLEPGDLIEIDRNDGVTVTFEVESLERHEQSDFPTRKVYSDLDYAGLRLITCTGVYSHDSLRYSHNLIVFARMVGESGE